MELVLASRPQAFLVALLCVLTLALGSEYILRRKAGVSTSASLGLTMVLLFLGVALLMFPGPSPADPGSPQSWLLEVRSAEHANRGTGFQDFYQVSLRYDLSKWLLLYARGLLGASVVMLGLPLLVMLYRKWFFGMASAAERQPGFAGVRAWARGSSPVAATIVIIGLWVWASWPIILLALLWLLLVSAYPMLLWLRAEPASGDVESPAPVAGLTSEQDRVLRLVEAGVVSGNEGVSLLRALGQSMPASMASSVGYGFGRSGKMMAAGFLLVLVGFFLPWIKVDLIKEYQRIYTSVRSSAQTSQPGGFSLGGNEQQILELNSNLLKMGFDEQNRAHMASAINQVAKLRGTDFTAGWIFLALVALVACVYLVPNDVSRNTQNMVLVFCSAGACVALLYVASIGQRYLALGFVVSTIGFVMVAFCVAKRLQKPFARNQDRSAIPG